MIVTKISTGIGTLTMIRIVVMTLIMMMHDEGLADHHGLDNDNHNVNVNDDDIDHESRNDSDHSTVLIQMTITVLCVWLYWS